MTRFCLVFVLFTSLLARVSLGQSSPDPSLETVQKWFDKEWEQAQTMPDFGERRDWLARHGGRLVAV